MGALILAYQHSPHWRRLSPASQSTYGIYLRPLADLRDHQAGAVTRKILIGIRDAIAEKRGDGAATGFVRVAKALFTWARKNSWLASSPALELETLEGGHFVAWSQAQADEALRLLPEHLRRVVLVGMHTGQRRVDLVTLQWSAYDGATLHFVQKKTKVELWIPVHGGLKAELDAWRRTATSIYILTQANGTPWQPVGLSHALPAALKRAGIAGRLNVHGLRKLAATRLAEAGCSALEIAAITGHRSLSMVQLYTASVDQGRMAAAAISKLENADRKTRKLKP